MSLSKKNTGRMGENIARKFLQEKGFEIVDQHFTTQWGEIDIVVKKGSKISFIEVKTRAGDTKGKPHELVHFRKLHHLKRSIHYYLLKNDLKTFKLSLDVIAIILNKDLSVNKISHYENVELPT